jgi:RNA polymerase sigma factor (sigma-70 family)
VPNGTRVDKPTKVKPCFATVLEEHGPMLLRFCRAQAGRNYGDDVFQETMLAALRAYDTVRDPAAVKSWLWSIAARKAIDAHRAAARTATPVAELEPTAHAPDPVEPDIWDDVALLPPKQRQAVTLRFMADLSHREIADVLRMSEDAVRRNVFEGLRRLRRELAPALPRGQTKEDA